MLLSVDVEASRMSWLGSNIVMRIIFQLLAVTIFLSGCFDPPLYRTPLPNGYQQSSNGGEFGHINLPISPDKNGGRVIAPIKDGHWVNRFGWAGDLVVGEIIEYGEKHVDPQHIQGYLLLDTVSGQVTYFDSLEELKTAWRKSSSHPLPTVKRYHGSTRKIRL